MEQAVASPTAAQIARDGGGIGAGDETLALHFVVGPSLDSGDIPLAELLEGRIEIATELAATSDPAVVESDPAGTSVTGAGAVLTVADGAAPDGTITGIGEVAVGDLPAGLVPEASFVLDVAGGAIDPAFTATINLGIQADAGQLFVLGRTTIVPAQGRVVSQAAAFGLGLGGGDILIQQCRAAGMCLPGFGQGGAYLPVENRLFCGFGDIDSENLEISEFVPKVSVGIGDAADTSAQSPYKPCNELQERRNRGPSSL